MELEYEGDPSFLTGGIEALLITMGSLADQAPEEALPPVPVAPVPPASGDGNGGAVPAGGGGALTYSTNTIAAHLDAKTGPELVISALAQLELVQGKSSSNRTEILAEMKGATTYYNQNMRSNMTKILAGLTSGKRINQVGKDMYALSATERRQVGAKVAEIG